MHNKAPAIPDGATQKKKKERKGKERKEAKECMKKKVGDGKGRRQTKGAERAFLAAAAKTEVGKRQIG